ncbi:MAG: hypothetical protein ABIG90_01590 [bacterium]
MKKLVLMDLDRTIINEAYQINDENIFNILKDVANSMVIGLNSDTPIISLRQWKDYLGIGHTGPLIAERGAIMEIQNEKHFVSKARFASFKQEVAQSIQNNLPTSKIILGDVTRMLIENQRFSDCSKIIMINGYRECSFSCYFRAIDNLGQPFIDRDWSNEILQIISNIFLPLHADEPFYDPDYGIFIINAADTDKAFGAKTLMDKYYPDYKLFMIGDSNQSFSSAIRFKTPF